MYLSRLTLNPRHRRVQRDLADCHELHRTVMKAFPGAGCESARDRWKVLHRADIDRRTGGVILLVQSSVEPDWSTLPNGYLAAGTGNPACKHVGSFEGITSGRTLVFRLRANPTKRLFDPAQGQMHGKRVELRTEDEQLAWLRRKGHQSGFVLEDVRAVPDVPNVRVVEGDKYHGRRNGSHLTFGSVLFEGRLRVTDAGTFREALLQGVGSGKAYGFGLLSVAPLRA